MKKSTSNVKRISKRKTVKKPSNKSITKKSKKKSDEELDREPEEDDFMKDDDGELEGLDGKEQPLFWFGPPPAIRVLYKDTDYDKDFHPADMVEHMRSGKTRSEIIAAWGITYSKFNEWLEAYPEMGEAYAVGKPAFDAYYKGTLRAVSFGQMPKAKEYSLHFMLKNFAGFDDSGGEHEYRDGETAELDFIDDE